MVSFPRTVKPDKKPQSAINSASFLCPNQKAGFEEMYSHQVSSSLYFITRPRTKIIGMKTAEMKQSLKICKNTNEGFCISTGNAEFGQDLRIIHGVFSILINHFVVMYQLVFLLCVPLLRRCHLYPRTRRQVDITTS